MPSAAAYKQILNCCYAHFVCEDFSQWIAPLKLCHNFTINQCKRVCSAAPITKKRLNVANNWMFSNLCNDLGPVEIFT